jgi:hypothetical protein
MELTIQTRRSKGVGSAADLQLEMKKNCYEAKKLVKAVPVKLAPLGMNSLSSFKS